MDITEGQKIRLKTEEIGRVVEVLGGGKAFMAEVFKKTGGISVETIQSRDIASVYVETEVPILQAEA